MTKSKKIVLPKSQARRLALQNQLLDGRTKLSRGKEGVFEIIDKLGYIQLDTISVVERAHHHTLWTRRPDYKQDHIDVLMAKERRIFEYWGHAASYLPMNDYRFYLPLMKNFAFLRSSWVLKWMEQHRTILPRVMNRIKTEGPLGSKDFEPPPGTKRGPWWSWKPAKFALEILFWQGKLMITERRKFERIYDLTERVLPSTVNTKMPSGKELGRFLVLRALQAYGPAREQEIVKHINTPDRKVVVGALKDMLKSGEIDIVQLEGDGKPDYFITPDNLALAVKLRSKKPQLHILSPFDNLIIQRDRLKRLFEFDYSLECYVPAPKRVHGYFVMPILWGEEFIGRLDPKADRKTKQLIIKKLLFENAFSDYEKVLPEFAKKLKQLAKFNDCEEIIIEQVKPAKVKKPLQKHLK